MASVKFGDDEDIIDIRYDSVFKAVFTRGTLESRKALSSLVSACIEKPVEVENIAANEPPAEGENDRQVRFDISCRTTDGRYVNVEMSLAPDPFEPVRLEYYAAKLYLSQDIRGRDRDYDDLEPTYQVAILGEGNFFGDEDFFHAFEYHDPKRGIPLGGRIRIVTLELSKLADAVRKPVSEMRNPELWGVFFRYLTDLRMRPVINAVMEREEGVAMAGQVLMGLSRDETERARLTSE